MEETGHDSTGEDRYGGAPAIGSLASVSGIRLATRAICALALVAGVVAAAAPAARAAAPDDPRYPQQWALAGPPGAGIDADSAWDALPGPLAPVTVAVLDAGIDFTNPDLAPVAWSNPGPAHAGTHGWDYVTASPTIATTSLVSGDHGTHVAGIVAARRGDATGVAGIAPNARIMSLRTFSKAGEGTLWNFDITDAVRFAIANGARVLNASYGDNRFEPRTCAALEEAADAGVLVVVSAGNDASDNDAEPVSPAACPSAGIITVASSTSTGALAGNSSFGAETVDLAAPGEQIMSTLPGAAWGNRSGTSMAAPQVAGAAALLFGADPSASAGEVRQAILVGVRPGAAFTGKVATGGRLDLARSLAFLLDGPPADASAPIAPRPTDPLSGDEVALTRTPTLTWAEARDPESAIGGYQVVLDGAVVADNDSARNRLALTEPLADGTHTWSVRATNGAGLVTESPVQAFEVAATPPPAPTILGPADGSEQQSKQVDFRFVVAPGSTYQVLIGDHSYAPPDPGVGWVGLFYDEPTTVVWRLRVRDAKGRTTTTAPMTVRAAAPAPPVVLPTHPGLAPVTPPPVPGYSNAPAAPPAWTPPPIAPRTPVTTKPPAPKGKDAAAAKRAKKAKAKKAKAKKKARAKKAKAARARAKKAAPKRP